MDDVLSQQKIYPARRAKALVLIIPLDNVLVSHYVKYVLENITLSFTSLTDLLLLLLRAQLFLKLQPPLLLRIQQPLLKHQSLQLLLLRLPHLL